MATFKTLTADFRLYPEASLKDQCMICLDKDKQLLSHVVSTAVRVHHVACQDCLQSWAQTCQKNNTEPCCPLCRQMLSERSLVKICSVFSSRFIKQRGDLWQRQYLELLQEIIATSQESQNIEKWNEQAEQVELELQFFLVSLRYSFVENISDPYICKHFIKSLDNFYDFVVMMKSLHVLNLITALPDGNQETSPLQRVFFAQLLHIENYVDNLGSRILRAKHAMHQDYKEYSGYDRCSKKFSVLCASVAMCCLWSGMSYLENQNYAEPAHQAPSYYHIAKIGLTVVTTVLAYVQVRKKTEDVAQAELLGRIKQLALE